MNQQEWTIMIYMAGDNNLSVDMAYAMQQIKDVAGTDTENVNLFVYYDGFASTIPTLYCDFSDADNPKHVRSYKVKDKIYPVETNPNENAADYRSIANFVDWCVNKAEHIKDGQVVRGRCADRYALIFSGHSMGFQDIGLFKDESDGKTMSMSELQSLLERITKSEEQLIVEGGDQNPDLLDSARTEPILGQKLDILGFDSCVMGMLEVGNQFDTVSKTMIASEGSVPSAGWTYAKILGNLAHNSKNMPVADIAANFVSEFVRSQDSYTIGGVSVDMAAWDFSQLPKLNAAFESLADALLECFSEKGSTIYKQMERVLLQIHWKCQTYMYDQNVDLGDMCELLLRECASLRAEVGDAIRPNLEKIESACKSVLRELNNTIILSGFSGGEYQYSNGISLFWPWSLAGYNVSEKNYTGLDFVENTRAGQKWNDFLATYLSEVTFRRSPGPTHLGNEPAGIVLESALHDEHADVRAYSMPESKLRYYSYQYEDNSVESVNGHRESDSKMAGQKDTKMAGQKDSKMPGQVDSKMAGQKDTKMAGQVDSKMAGQKDTKMAGQKDSKMPGQVDSKMPGQVDSKMPGQVDSKMPGQVDSKMPGQVDSKMAGQKDSKMPGQLDSKMPGQVDSKMPGQKDSKMAGQKDSKLAGQKDSKMAGQKDTKMAGQKDTKMGGQKDSKLAGGGGGESSVFFESLRAFKNLEEPWNISGFTKEPRRLVEELKSKKTTTS